MARVRPRPVEEEAPPALGPSAAEVVEKAAASAIGDFRALRVSVAAASRLDGDPSMTVSRGPDAAGQPLVNGESLDARLVRLGEGRAVLERGSGPLASRTPVILGPARVRPTDGTVVREIVVEGWRVEVEIEPERRAQLRERARRGGGVAGASGPLEVRAIIPGRIVAVSIAQGETVEAGQQILVLEAMKMQNELRAPRDGTIERVAVAVGENVEVGDLLLVIS